MTKSKMGYATYLGTFALIVGAILFGTSCKYDSEEDLYGITDCGIVDASYSIDILPLLEDNCYVCHAANISLGGIVLEGYSNVKTLVNSGQFLGAIRHDPGFSPMPQGAAQLKECDIELVEKWIDDGALDN